MRNYLRFFILGIFFALPVNASASKGCPDIRFDVLKKEIADCVANDRLSRSQCIVRKFNCANTITTSSGLSGDVKIVGLFNVHEDRFYVSQNRFHYREVIFDGMPNGNRDANKPIKEYQIGFGYQFTIKQKDASSHITGIVQNVSEQLSLNTPSTFSFVGIIGIDPQNNAGGAIYNSLSVSNSNTTPESYLDAYSKIDGEFDRIYSNLLDKEYKGSEVKICPQFIAVRYSEESATKERIAAQERDDQKSHTEEDMGSKLTQIESLCDTTGRWPNGVFMYAFTNPGAALGASNGGDTGAANNSTTLYAGATSGYNSDKINIKYARRRFFAVMDNLDLHTEYFATGSKSSFGSGSLLGALLSISGSSDKINNAGYAFGYPSCMKVMPVNHSSPPNNLTLPQLQSLSILRDSFNFNTYQVNNWATSEPSNCKLAL